ncbi:MAG: helix-turn-helix transcriptional regulator [Lachnospiraceae bacterium]|jgi:transcriptional regulator with XRE-family HTH domain|nr:helix-turn-helix transcriptional regulator [Lachnospiraceae bacterium]
MASFQRRFKELRHERGWTLDDLAELLGTTKSTLSRYENGLREPKIEFAEKSAGVFGVSTDYLLGKSDSRKGEDDAQLKMLFRKAGELSDEEREEVLSHFENTLNLYLRHKRR